MDGYWSYRRSKRKLLYELDEPFLAVFTAWVSSVAFASERWNALWTSFVILRSIIFAPEPNTSSRSPTNSSMREGISFFLILRFVFHHQRTTLFPSSPSMRSPFSIHCRISRSGSSSKIDCLWPSLATHLSRANTPLIDRARSPIMILSNSFRPRCPAGSSTPNFLIHIWVARFCTGEYL